MTTKPGHAITPEKLKKYSINELKNLLENAKKRNANDVAQMCNDELNQRAPEKARPTKGSSEYLEGDIVTGYHFVCSKDRGVIEVEDGQFWSGSWVVSEQNVQTSIKYVAYLALHETKAQNSYRQGRILNYRRSPREMVKKSEDGIEFLVQTTNEPYAWVGAGTGEKGYRWEKLIVRHRVDVAR